MLEPRAHEAQCALLWRPADLLAAAVNKVDPAGWHDAIEAEALAVVGVELVAHVVGVGEGELGVHREDQADLGRLGLAPVREAHVGGADPRLEVAEVPKQVRVGPDHEPAAPVGVAARPAATA